MKKQKKESLRIKTKNADIAIVKNKTADDLMEKKSGDSIQNRDKEIQREKESPKFKRNSRTFDTFVVDEPEHGPFGFIHQLYCKFFHMEAPAYAEMISSWNFPKEPGSRTKTHKVWRRYGAKFMIDMFDAKTPMKEIRRIKAHLEALGFSYTFALGGEMVDENYPKLIFIKRIKPTKNVKVFIPKTFEEAGLEPVRT